MNAILQNFIHQSIVYSTQRLKKKMKFAIMHFDAALRVPNLARELKMLVMHELGLSLLIELNFHDAKHYFNELK